MRIAALVCARRKDVDFVYLGDGPLFTQARDLAQALGVETRVHLMGWQRMPRRLAAGFDVFLLPSLFEGLPCSLPQVLSLGVPAVASQVDGNSEIVREGVNGYLCQPRDVQAFADRVGALLDDDTLRRRMAGAAAGSVGPEFGFDAMVARSAQLYRGVA